MDWVDNAAPSDSDMVITAACFLNAHLLVVAYKATQNYFPLRIWDLNRNASRSVPEQMLQRDEVLRICGKQNIFVTVSLNNFMVWNVTTGLVEFQQEVDFGTFTTVYDYIDFGFQKDLVVAQVTDAVEVMYKDEKVVVDYHFVDLITFSDDGLLFLCIHHQYEDSPYLLSIWDTITKRTIFSTELSSFSEDFDDFPVITQALFSKNRVILATTSVIYFLDIIYGDGFVRGSSSIHIRSDEKTTYSDATFTMGMVAGNLLFYRDARGPQKFHEWSGTQFQNEWDVPYAFERNYTKLIIYGKAYAFVHYESTALQVFKKGFHPLIWQNSHVLLKDDFDIAQVPLQKYPWKSITDSVVDAIVVTDLFFGEDEKLLVNCLENDDGKYYFWVPPSLKKKGEHTYQPSLCYGFSKEMIQTMKNDRNNVRYGCKEGVVEKEPNFNLKAMGFYFGLLPMAELNSALVSKHRVFELTNTGTQFSGVATLTKLIENPTANHCQEHTNDSLFKIRYVPKYYFFKNQQRRYKNTRKTKLKTKRKTRTQKTQKNK